jgi:zinc transport system substrate-binding protein
MLRLLALLLSSILCLLLPSCSREELKEKKPIVLVSIPPYAFFVAEIAGQTVDIRSLVPIGVNPHIYEPTPKEVQGHQNAALWVRLGESFDTKVSNYFKTQHVDVKVVDVTQGISLLSFCDENGLITEHATCDHHEGKDLHIWLSPRLAKKQAALIAEGLIAILPHNEEHYRNALTKITKKLDELDQKLQGILKDSRGTAILVSHPSFGYFCRDYGLIQLSIEMEGKEPLPQDVTEILKNIKRYNIQKVFLQPQYSNKGAELIAKRLNLPTYVIDPYTADYEGTLINLAHIIAHP